MFDFVWRSVSVVCVSVLVLLPFALTGAVELLFGCGMLGGAGLLAMFQIGVGDE